MLELDWLDKPANSCLGKRRGSKTFQKALTLKQNTTERELGVLQGY